MINYPIPFWRVLNFIVATNTGGRVDRSGSDHIQVNICNTRCQMLIGIHTAMAVVPVFPESSLTILSRIEFLRRSSCYQLQAPRKSLFVGIHYQEGNVVRENGIIQHTAIIPLLCLIQATLKQELLLMGTVDYMPDVSGDIMSIGSWQKSRFLLRRILFTLKKTLLRF